MFLLGGRWTQKHRGDTQIWGGGKAVTEAEIWVKLLQAKEAWSYQKLEEIRNRISTRISEGRTDLVTSWFWIAAAAKSLQSCPTLCDPIDGRLPRPWDSPGKNTGGGCHFLLQSTKVKSESEVAQSWLSCTYLSYSLIQRLYRIHRYHRIDKKEQMWKLSPSYPPKSSYVLRAPMKKQNIQHFELTELQNYQELAVRLATYM